MSYMTIRVRKSAGDSGNNYCFEEGSSVADIMEKLALRSDKYDIIRNDEVLDDDEVLSDGDEIVIADRKLSSGC